MGGVFKERGVAPVTAWLEPLFHPYILEAYRIVRVEHGLPAVPTPPSPSPSRSASPSHSSGGSGRDRSPAARHRLRASIGHLSLFNQHLQQQCKSIEWVYSDSAGEGTKTTPIWVVRAMVEGECLGRGRGSTKKAARNEAAKEGLVKLGELV